jgi:RNA polymerase sigma factor (TIGR02999 family)
MENPSSQEITGMLLRWGQGDEHALDSLIPIVYDDLHRLAAYLLGGERRSHTLQATALVNEAYLKLAGRPGNDWQNRSHFVAIAARAMRQILVDYARSRGRKKRRMNATPLPLDDAEAIIFTPERSDDLLALDEALERLYTWDTRKARVVELRYFGGMDNHEIAELLQTSANTVMRDWNFAKAWLGREMGANVPEAESGLERERG